MPVLDCFDENLDDTSLNMDVGGFVYVYTIRECQKLCQNTIGCRRFVYIKFRHGGHGASPRNNCKLKDERIANYKVVQDVVSGPAFCIDGESMVTLYSCVNV